MAGTNRARNRSSTLILAHIDRSERRTVATLVARVVVEHAHNDCERQTALDFGGADTRPTSAQSGVHVIDCDALLDAGDREIGGAA